MILVTGAMGTVGRATVAALQARNAVFKVGVRAPSDAKALGADGVAFDWTDPRTFGPALMGVERLFVLTPVSELSTSWMVQLTAAAHRAAVTHVVRLSASGADEEPGTIFGRMHLGAEKVVRSSGLAWTILRPTLFMQNFLMRYGVDPRRDRQVALPHGTGKAAWIDAHDVGEVAATVLSSTGHAGKVYELSGPEALTTAECLGLLGRALRHHYEYLDVPEVDALKALEARYPPWLADAYLETHARVKRSLSAGVAWGVQTVLGRGARSFAEYARDVAAETGRPGRGDET